MLKIKQIKEYVLPAVSLLLLGYLGCSSLKMFQVHLFIHLIYPDMGPARMGQSFIFGKVEEGHHAFHYRNLFKVYSAGKAFRLIV